MGRVVDSVRLWGHPQVVWAVIVLYARWLRLVGNYCLNRALGVPVDEVPKRMLDPRGRCGRRGSGCTVAR